MKTIAPVRPNAGLGIIYQRKLENLIDEMHRSTHYWIMAAYRARKPEMALDASPAAILRQLFDTLGRYWLRRFKEIAPEIARYFATHVDDRVSGTLADLLRQQGFTVSFRNSREANDVLQAAIGENVSLITNIAERHLFDIETAVMRTVQLGGDLGYLANHLEDNYNMTKKRAKFIAQDQNSKATAVITRVRQVEAGITYAIWLHSHGGVVPRPSHLAFNGHVYDVNKGAYLKEGKKMIWTFPGHEINCRCVSRSIIPALGIPAQYKDAVFS